MVKLQFSVVIESPRDKVWDILWNDSSYREWTSAFAEGCYAVSDWKEGSRILFLSPKGEGMYSVIEKKIPNEYMSFRHLGVVKDGKEQPDDAQSNEWSDARETYALKGKNGNTELVVEMNSTEAFQDYFKTTFPKALEKVKELAES